MNAGQRLGAAGRAIFPFAALAVPLALIVLAASWSSPVLQRETTTMLINVVLVVGFFFFAGNAGILSFGHMSFMAIGAYAGALLTIPALQKGFLLPDLPAWLATAELGSLPAALLASAAAAAFALLVAIPLMRLPGLAISLAMFAVLVIVHDVTSNWTAVTRGRQSMIGVPTNTTMTVALVGALVTIAAAYAFKETKTGLRVRASREDEVAARSIGVNLARDRGIAFVLSAFFIGLGGFLYAQFLGVFNPDAFYLNITFIVIAMLVVGGTKSVAGAVVGPVAVSVLTYGLRQAEKGFDLGVFKVPGRPGLQEVGLALAMLLILLFRPRGITSGREFSWPARWTRRGGRAALADAGPAGGATEGPAAPPGAGAEATGPPAAPADA